jgi:uncharacterized protein YjbJ (UPF0337 family)
MERQDEGRRQQLHGRLKAIWGELTDDDIDRVEGNRERLIGVIKEKTGAAEAMVRARLGELFEEVQENGGRGRRRRDLSAKGGKP